MQRPGYASAAGEEMQSRLSRSNYRLAVKSSWRAPCHLLAVRDPDIFHLSCVFEEPAAFRNFRIEPVDDTAFVGPDLFQISDRHGFGCGNGGFVSVAPNGVNVVVLGERLEKLRSVARHNVHRAGGHIAGVEELIEITGNQRVSF